MDEPFGVFSSREREMLKHVFVLTISVILACGAIAASAQASRARAPSGQQVPPVQPPSGTPIPAAQPPSAAIARPPLVSPLPHATTEPDSDQDFHHSHGMRHKAQRISVPDLLV
jgi:hypothetical protein